MRAFSAFIEISEHLYTCFIASFANIDSMTGVTVWREKFAKFEFFVFYKVGQRHILGMMGNVISILSHVNCWVQR